ncbi:MAG: YicC family protein, partial [Gammaproteobacteria bacterium]|nr:YicC family protein [Gammaproteobacteria bacterium]
MTAFARRDVRENWGNATWELRTVNHRYTDIFIRMPEELRVLEPEVRKRVGARIKRGKVECLLRFDATTSDSTSISINTELAGHLAKVSREIDQMLYCAAPVASMDVMRWPGVLQVNKPDMEVAGKAILACLDDSIDDLVATRTREGETISTFLHSRLDEMEPYVADVHARIPNIIAKSRDRLRSRLEELRNDVDEQRLEQEIVIFAQKIDVSEELDRLETHIGEVRRVLSEDKPVGRRLDFLMQEFNRETNTLASKSAAV